MKLNSKTVLSAVSLLVGGFIGASALVALASGTWSAPHQVPPNCDPTLDSGCYAPISVGTGDQVKNGGLSVNAFVASLQSFFAQKVTIGTTASPATIQIVDGNQGSGKVLTSDASGNGSWSTVTVTGSAVSGTVGGGCWASNMTTNPVTWTTYNTGATTVATAQIPSISAGTPGCSCATGYTSRVTGAIWTNGNTATQMAATGVICVKN